MKENTKRILTALVLIPVALTFVLNMSLAVSFAFYFFFSLAIGYELMNLLPVSSALEKRELTIAKTIFFIFFIAFIILQLKTDGLDISLFSNNFKYLAGQTFYKNYLPLFFLFFLFIASQAVLGTEKKGLEPSFQFKTSLFFHTFLSYFLITFAVFSLLRLKHFPDNFQENTGLSLGQYYLLFALAITWLYDSLAYTFGRLLGKTKLELNVSPKKSLAGLIGGSISTCVILLLTRITLFSNGSSLQNEIIFKSTPLFIASIFFLILIAQMGDLFASLLKRTAKVKDSGKILPGHGGVYDRSDALLLVCAALCEWVYFLGQVD